MRNWGMFWLLSLIWGSSFLLIKIAVEELGPFPLVSIRLGVAALIMGAYLYTTRRFFPKTRRERLALLYVGVMNTAVPFTLITWGEQEIDSGLATVLNATVPLWTLVFAHAALSDEKINLPKVAGLLLGFVGVIILAGRDVDSSSQNSLGGQLAVLLASASYASSAVTIRRFLRGVDAYTIAGFSLVIGAVTILVITPLVADLPNPADVHAGALLAAVTLAVVNTVMAYFLFYHLITTWGATRATLVTYALPPVGVTLGAIFLDEAVDWRILLGAGLILSGILVVNLHRQRRVAAPAADASTVDAPTAEPAISVASD